MVNLFLYFAGLVEANYLFSRNFLRGNLMIIHTIIFTFRAKSYSVDYRKEVLTTFTVPIKGILTFTLLWNRSSEEGGNDV